MLTIGSKAPDFRAKLDTGEVVRLRDMLGKSAIVITFFPDDFIKSDVNDVYVFLQQLQKVKSLGAEVLIISPKGMLELRKLLTLYNYSIQIASDPDLEICRNYRAVWLRGVALRKLTYVIDSKGIIHGCLNHQLLNEKPWKQVLRLLKEINSEKEFIAL